MKVNVFNPNGPASPRMFVGRTKEIDALEKGLNQTRHGRQSNFLLTGRAGIGKSSIMNFVKKTIASDAKFNFLSIDILMSEKTTIFSLIILIKKKIIREIKQIEATISPFTESWMHSKFISFVDSEIEHSLKIKAIDILIDEAAYFLAKVCEEIKCFNKKKYDGIVFFIDEADNASENLHIGYFFKVFTELLEKNECRNIMFIVAGKPNVMEKLSRSHQSSVRVFSHLKITELTPDERKDVIDRGMEVSNEINLEKIEMSAQARNLISDLSEGCPHFIQRLGFSLLEENDNGEINKGDVELAL